MAQACLFCSEVVQVNGGISDARLAQLRAMIDQGTEDEFYSWDEWRRDVRPKVLKLDRNECQLCAARGKVRSSTAGARLIVHHVKHLRDRPDLALSVYDPDTGERQLLTVCKDCHEALHPESMRQYEPRTAPLTAERWD